MLLKERLKMLILRAGSWNDISNQLYVMWGIKTKAPNWRHPAGKYPPRAHSPPEGRRLTAAWLTIGDGDKAMLPIEAFSTSTEGAVTTWSAGSGLILILNFFRWSSSSSDSSEEKKADFLGASSSLASRKASCPSSASHLTKYKGG